MDLDKIAQDTEALVRRAGAFQLTHFRTISPGQILDKGLNQLVSFVDVETEKMLVSGLQTMISEAGFVTEESTVDNNKDKDWVWIIDPLDGTTNFLHGLPAFCVSVALAHKGVLVLGHVFAPAWDEMFVAQKGKGATLNGAPLSCSKTPDLQSSLLATGFPYYEFEYMQLYLNALSHFMKHTHGLRRFGSAAIDLAWVAAGRFDGFFELGLHAWDVAAGVLLVQEAGGQVSDFRGGEDYLYGETIIASGTALFPEFQKQIQSHFNT